MVGSRYRVRPALGELIHGRIQPAASGGSLFPAPDKACPVATGKPPHANQRRSTSLTMMPLNENPGAATTLPGNAVTHLTN